MPRPTITRLAAFVAVLTLGSSSAVAQESKALINALVRKGVLTNDEAAAIVAEVKGEPAPVVSTTESRFLRRLAIGGRMQVQYVGLSTDIAGAAGQPSATDHFLLRRMQLGVKAELTDRWSGTLTYDFSGGTFDGAFITWKYNDALVIDTGLKKVPFLLDELTSSGDLRAIERAPVTRYFVEGNNGRRLGAGSYHVGVFAGGKLPLGLYYNVAVTNPERDETFSGVASAGNRANNRQAFWGDAGIANTLGRVSYRLGASGGYLPDQGGRATGVGDNLAVLGAYAEVRSGGLFVRAEYAWSQNEHGVSPTQDANSWGYYIMPAYRLGNFEGVVRYSAVESDGRGVDVSDGVRSAPTSGSLNAMNEWFIGANYYFHENDTKFQLGYVRAEAQDALTGVPAQATTEGVRSQLQINF